MFADALPYLLVLMPLIACLYASVGHGGASSYIMVLTFFAVATSVIKPTSLLLNIGVSAIAFGGYVRASNFQWRLFVLLAIGSIPLAYIGGTIQIDAQLYRKILGFVLLVPALRLFNLIPIVYTQSVKPHPILILSIGSIIGFISGLLGIGGGILLSPVLLFFGWASIKETATISALFICLNSISGLVGYGVSNIKIENDMLMLLPVTLAGGMLGTYLGSKKWNDQILKYVLGAVLLVAAIKFII